MASILWTKQACLQCESVLLGQRQSLLWYPIYSGFKRSGISQSLTAWFATHVMMRMRLCLPMCIHSM